jgi:hypothetical protein
MGRRQVLTELIYSFRPHRGVCLVPSSLALYYQELVCSRGIFLIVEGMQVGVSLLSGLCGMFILRACYIAFGNRELEAQNSVPYTIED